MKVQRLLLMAALLATILIMLASGIYLTTSGITLHGTITDAASGQPLAQAGVTLGSKSTHSNAQGLYTLIAAPRDGTLTGRLDGYHPAQAALRTDSALARDAQLDLALEPLLFEGIVTEAASGRPLAGVSVSVGDKTVLTAGDGAYRFTAVHNGSAVLARADGFADYSAVFAGENGPPISLGPNTVTVTVVDDAGKSPITDAQLSVVGDVPGGDMPGNDIQSSAQGQFVLHGVKQKVAFAAQADGYLPATVSYDGAPAITLPLAANSVSGLLRDQYSGKPLAGITITLTEVDNNRNTQSDGAGGFQFRRVRMGAVLSAASPGHDPATITYTGQLSLPLVLRPNTLRGVVSDIKTHQPIAGAFASVGDVTAKTTDKGEYTLAGIAAGLPLIVNAPGYDRNRQAIDQVTAQDVSLRAAINVRAIYIPFYLLTVPERVGSLINFADRAGMNALVIDIKGDDGYLAYKSQIALARDIKAQYAGSMMGLDEVLDMAKKRGMYTIARMVVFKDNLLAERRPDLAVKDKRTNAVWDDCGNGSTYWADPFRKEVVDYNAGIAEEAGRLGFDEIQLDYIRFPPACVSQTRLANASYAVTSTMETRLAAIDTFLAESRRRLQPMGVAISVDTFGWTLMRDDDLAIGQRLENMARYVDYISPMVYPSTWEPGAMGLDYPPAHPYDIVYKTMAFAVDRLKDTNVKLRPWLQDFDDYGFKELPYGVKELDEQRRGAADAGAVGWMLWNAGGSYTEETVVRP